MKTFFQTYVNEIMISAKLLVFPQQMLENEDARKKLEPIVKQNYSKSGLSKHAVLISVLIMQAVSKHSRQSSYLSGLRFAFPILVQLEEICDIPPLK